MLEKLLTTETNGILGKFLDTECNEVSNQHVMLEQISKTFYTV